jgi:hypothetical protein
VTADANVFLVDSVDTRGGVQLVKAFFLDPQGARLDRRSGTLAPLLRLSPDIVAFLQCEAYPSQPMNRMCVAIWRGIRDVAAGSYSTRTSSGRD